MKNNDVGTKKTLWVKWLSRRIIKSKGGNYEYAQGFKLPGIQQGF
jgi:hypothetical protein